MRRGFVSTCLVAGAVLAALVPPAQASTIVCETLLPSTPTVRADIDGDGYPEYRVPAIQDITLCSDAGASYTTSTPRTENCFIGWHPTCIAVYVDLMPVNAAAGASGELCFRVENSRFPTCREVRTPPTTAPVAQTACIGFDLGGGHPCSGSVVAVTLQ